MNKPLLLLALLLAALVVAVLVFRFMPKSGAAPGLSDGQLMQCPATPNCVCSEFEQDADHYIEPLAIPEAVAAVNPAIIREAIVAIGGEVVMGAGDYLAATFTSELFRFVDDVEVRVDAEQGLIHIRSASRLGKSDLGVNRQRVEKLKVELARLLDQ